MHPAGQPSLGVALLALNAHTGVHCTGASSHPAGQTPLLAGSMICNRRQSLRNRPAGHRQWQFACLLTHATLFPNAFTQSPTPAVRDGSGIRQFGTVGASLQPVGHSAEPSVVTSRSHVAAVVTVQTQAEPEQPAASHVFWSVEVLSEQDVLCATGSLCWLAEHTHSSDVPGEPSTPGTFVYEL